MLGRLTTALKPSFSKSGSSSWLRSDVLVLAAPARLGVPQEVPDEGEHPGGVVPPGRVFPQAVPQEVVGEQAPVLEVFAGVGGGVEDAAELVELLQGVLAGPGEPPQGAQVQPGRAAAVDADRSWARPGCVRPPAGPFCSCLRLSRKHELQGVEVGGQDQQVVEVALAQDPDQVVADLGRQRLRLGEDDPEELLLVLGQQLDLLDGAGRFARQPDRLGREERHGRLVS